MKSKSKTKKYHSDVIIRPLCDASSTDATHHFSLRCKKGNTLCGILRLKGPNTIILMSKHLQIMVFNKMMLTIRKSNIECL